MFHVDILERRLRHSPLSVLLLVCPIVLLNRNLLLANFRDNRNMTKFSSICLRDAPNLWRVVDFDAGSLGSFVPGVGIAPMVAFVLVGEFHAGFVKAVGDEARALTLIDRSVVDK